MKVAKLVLASLMVRVIVNDDATEDDIIQVSKKKFNTLINENLGDNIEEIYDDEDVPATEDEELT